MVIHAAKTGKDKTNKNAVISKAQGNRGVFSKVTLGSRIFKIVTIIFKAPIKEESPAKCKATIAKSTEGLL